MKLNFLGAVGTVTGSRFLVTEANHKILIDCGLFQGYKELRQRNWQPFPVDPRTIEAVVLTHAHLDHSGYLPLLVKQGFKGPIYCSYATADLASILLLDSGRLQEEDARSANKYGYSKHKPALPLYTEEDAKKALKNFHPIDFDKERKIVKGITFTLAFSGHILGSSFVSLKAGDKTLLFSGDVGRPNDLLMKPAAKILSADYLVLESTYGNRSHSTSSPLEQLQQTINATIARGGVIVIPSFAVGRAQTLLYALYLLKQAGKIPQDIPVYLDSPMALNATDLLCRYIDELRLSPDMCPNIFSDVHFIRTRDESKRLNDLNQPAIIISASGMAEGGRVLYHLAHYASDPKNMILFAGFQAEGTRGDKILRGEKFVTIHGQSVPVQAAVANLDSISSHADFNELLSWLKEFTEPPKTTFLTHGEESASQALKSKIEGELGWNVVLPQYLKTYELGG